MRAAWFGDTVPWNVEFWYILYLERTLGVTWAARFPFSFLCDLILEPLEAMFSRECSGLSLGYPKSQRFTSGIFLYAKVMKVWRFEGLSVDRMEGWCTSCQSVWTYCIDFRVVFCICWRPFLRASSRASSALCFFYLAKIVLMIMGFRLHGMTCIPEWRLSMLSRDVLWFTQKCLMLNSFSMLMAFLICLCWFHLTGYWALISSLVNYCITR